MFCTIKYEYIFFYKIIKINTTEISEIQLHLIYMTLIWLLIIFFLLNSAIYENCFNILPIKNVSQK